MKMLTNSEIMDINQNAEFDSAIGYARKIESAVLEKLKAQEPVAWQIRNGLCHAGIRGNQLDAELTAANMQKCHDLGGSLAAFNVRPLYAPPLPPDDVVRDAERYRWLRDSGKGDDLIRGDCRGVYLPESAALDQAIDAAMEKMK